MPTTNPKFSLGRQVVATPGALEALAEAGQTPHELLARHLRCDWGDVCHEDATLNDESLKDGSRLLSTYTLRTGEKLWIITEAVGDDGQRSHSTILKPEDY
ncbi:MAG TPA: hypothetical protein PKD86_00130 [Gemmatales bacterium]|nr:hypothetical protein [Gemmatales bacterium]